MHSIAATCCLPIAVAAAAVLWKAFPVRLPAGRYATIDGLRGYLALLVFLNHATVWYFYLRTARWEPPATQFYIRCGEGAVELFFMITGFLFCSKLLHSAGRSLDWKRLYISRLFRLTPLYLFVMACLFLVVAHVSDYSRHVSWHDLLASGMRWIGFTILGTPDINAVKDTGTIISGVSWSLVYEWCFYFSLPLVALLLQVRVPGRYVIASALIVVAEVFLRLPAVHLVSFAGGLTASLLVRWPAARTFAQTRVAAVVALLAMSLAIGTFSDVEQVLPILLLAVGFVLIACGSSLLGILTNPISRMMGELSYSIYLLHGLILFCVFRFVIGWSRAVAFSPTEHWLVVVACTPVLIAGSLLTFRAIEAPAIAIVPLVTTWAESRLMRRRPAAAAKKTWHLSE